MEKYLKNMSCRCNAVFGISNRITAYMGKNNLNIREAGSRK